MATYEDLGVKPFINGVGTVTTEGGSLMAPEVLDAMRSAASAFVDVPDLNEKAAAYLARRIGVEAVHISCGAASGVQLSAAACLTGADKDRVRALPRTEGWKNEFVISLVDSHSYIHQGIEVCGGTLVRVGTKEAVTTQDMLNGINDRTAAIVFFLGTQTWEQLSEVCKGAVERGTPVIVDAAAQLPPRSNLTEILGLGASLVVFSGGKGVCGPQSAGLVLGKKTLVEAVRMNASPSSAIGRGMKVGKEEILAIVTALDRFLDGSDEADRARWDAQSRTIVEAVAGAPGVKGVVMAEGQQAAPAFAPRAYVEFEDDALGETARDLMRRLREGTPSIHVRRTKLGFLVDPMTLQVGEERVIAERLREELQAG